MDYAYIVYPCVSRPIGEWGMGKGGGGAEDFEQWMEEVLAKWHSSNTA